MYVPLHVHTRYSLLDGLIDVKAAARHAADAGMPAIAITDHGQMYGAVAFYKACREQGVKPIIGMEAYVVSDLETDKPSEAAHLVLLARNDEGYYNLMELATEAALGATVRAVADHKMLAKYGKGLIGMSACLAGAIPRALLQDDLDEAHRLARLYADIFDAFYIEIQPNSIPEQKAVNPMLVDLARSVGCSLVATTDAHYLHAEDAAAHDVLLAVQVAKSVSDPQRLRFSVDDFFVMNEEEMRSRLLESVDEAAADEALQNTLDIAEQCNVAIQLGLPAMPIYSASDEERTAYADSLDSPESLLRAMARSGMIRIGRLGNPGYRARLAMELDVICDAGFAPYFLIVQDIIGWAKRNGIVVGPARGSAAGSLVAYALNITEVDPLKHGLIFERFLNAERAMSDYDWLFAEYPHIQEDVAAEARTLLDPVHPSFTPQEYAEAQWEIKQIARQGALEYYQDLAEFAEAGIQFEHNSPQSFVAYAIGITNEKPSTVSRTRLRVIRQGSAPDIDVDIEDTERKRVMEYVYERYGREKCAQIGNITTMGAKDALRRVAKAFELDKRDVNDIAAAVPESPGISIENALKESQELDAYSKEWPDVFKYAQAIEGCASTTSVHAAGIAIAPDEIVRYTPLHKGRGDVIVTQYDMSAIGDLALKIDLLGLSTMTDIRNVLELAGLDYAFLKRIPLDDHVTLQLLRDADTDGVFQVSSMLFKRLLKEVQPMNFGELADIVALGRPGPGSMADSYIARKHGREPIDYPHSRMEPILRNTHGIMIYQEQVMNLAKELAGYTLGQADLLRKAMGKKLPEVMEKERARFVEGCAHSDINEKAANEIFDHIAEFASYGFNASHSVSYAYISYWTAYLKAHYPAEFVTACLTREAASAKTERKENMGRYLAQVRHMGIEIKTPDINLSEPGFSIEPHGEQGDRKAIRMGLTAIDGLGPKAVEEITKKRPYASLADFLERTNRRIISRARMKALAYAGCFDGFDCNRNAVFRAYMESYIERSTGKAKRDAEAMRDSISPDWTTSERRLQERAVFGFVVNNPGMFASTRNGDYVNDLIGVSINVDTVIDKFDREMAFVTLDTEDSETVRVVVFARLFKQKARIVRAGRLLSVSGRKDGNSLLADSIVRLDQGN